MPAKAQKSGKVEPAKMEPAKAEPAKTEPAKAEAKAAPAKVALAVSPQPVLRRMKESFLGADVFERNLDEISLFVHEETVP